VWHKAVTGRLHITFDQWFNPGIGLTAEGQLYSHIFQMLVMSRSNLYAIIYTTDIPKISRTE
jgi:hypothetical protein